MRKLKSNEGFTLVELMVVVAIIGILSAVAIPNFKKYQAKSKTSEAKLQLASLYTAEAAAMADYDSYGTCLTYMGYTDPGNGGTGSNYYAVGFNGAGSANGNIDNNSGTTGCTSDTTSFYPASRGAKGDTVADVSSGASVPPDSTGSTFVATAVGSISADATNYNVWTIDQDKLLIQTTVGF